MDSATEITQILQRTQSKLYGLYTVFLFIRCSCLAKSSLGRNRYSMKLAPFNSSSALIVLLQMEAQIENDRSARMIKGFSVFKYCI